jgi:4-hydroxy-tetrahydrodipicolinate reductase
MDTGRRLRVCIAGASGWVGRPLCAAVAAASDLELAGAVSRATAGRRLRDVVPEAASDLTLSASVPEALAVPTDVLVDYTSPEAVRDNALSAIAKRVHVVIGTSGLTDHGFAAIDAAARAAGVGVTAVGNFSVAAILLQRFAVEAARHMPAWEIVDYASAAKPDAPSGTARELAARLGAVRRPAMARPVEDTVGPRESRGATLHGVQVHSLRLPGYVISLEALFGDGDQRLSIRYDAGPSPEAYIAGTLRAVRNVGRHVGLVRGLELE